MIKPLYYTQIPNSVLDGSHQYSESELRVMLFFCRNTFGWQKARCVASTSFIAKWTHLSDVSVFNAVKRLLETGDIQRFKCGMSFEYELKVEPESVSEPSGNLLKTLVGNESEPTQNFSRNPLKTLVGTTPKPTQNLSTKKERDLKKKKETLFVIPEALRVPEFEAAWSGWVDECAKRRKPLTERAAAMQLAKCESWGVAKAIASITASIENRWQGLFEPRANAKRASIDPNFRQNDTNGSQASHSWKMIQQKMKRDEELALADLARQDAMEIPI